MTKILIPNLYTSRNKGDAAIVIGMVKALKKYVPDADITILSSTPEIDREKYQKYKVRVLRNLLILPPEDSSPKLVKGAKLLLKMLKFSLWSKLRFPLNRAEREIANAYADASIVVACGGGLLGGHHVGSLLHVYGTYFAKLLGKPTIIYGQSIEPFKSKIISLPTQFMLNRVDLITVREEFSLDYLKALAIRPKTILTADASFLVKSIPTDKSMKLLAEEGVRQSQRPLIGITVREWDFPGTSDASFRFANYVQVIKETAEWLISNKKAKILFFPQVIYPPKDDDTTVSHEIASRIGQKRNVSVLTKDYSPQELKGAIGQMDLFIGTRMHSNIFSLSMGVPTIAISYQKKTDGIMKMLGMADYVLDIADLRFDGITSVIDKAWANRSEIKQQLKKKLPEVESLAWYNAELVKELLEQTQLAVQK